MIEKSPRLGGLIRTDIVQGCQIEAGPDSYIAPKPAVTQLAERLNLKQEIIGSNDSQRRVYIVRDGRFVEMPKGMAMMVPGDLNAALKSRLFSRSTKLRFLTEIFSPRRERAGDISIQELVVSHFGQEMLDYVTEPLLSGVYGGDSAKLSARSVLPRFVGYERGYGSLIRGVRRERRAPAVHGSLFLSFRRGMQTLIDALADVPTLHEEVLSVEPQSNGWRVKTKSREMEASHIVLAAPAHAAAAILSESAPEIASELTEIPYSSAILVTLVFREEDAPIPEGFGFLVPRRERQTIAAATFVGTKWPGRIPEGLAALRAFIVDPEAPRLTGLSNEELLALVRADFDRLLGITADPVLSTIDRWPNSMPQYVVGHEGRRKRIMAAIADCRGLYLTGNAYDGVGVPDCVRLAKDTAAKIAFSAD